jgi:hypothetical protein
MMTVASVANFDANFSHSNGNFSNICTAPLHYIKCKPAKVAFLSFYSLSANVGSLSDVSETLPANVGNGRDGRKRKKIMIKRHEILTSPQPFYTREGRERHCKLRGTKQKAIQHIRSL